MANGIVLALHHMRWPFKYPATLINTGSLHYASINRDITFEHGQPALLAIGMIQCANATVLAINIEGWPTRGLAEGSLCWNTGWPRPVKSSYLFRFCFDNVPLIQGFLKSVAMHRG